MPRKRPTESSWDSDEDLLKDDDSISLNVYPLEKEMEEVDEDALLAGSDDETHLPETAKANVSRNNLVAAPSREFSELEEEEELIEIEVEDPDDLEESVGFDKSKKNVTSGSPAQRDSAAASTETGQSIAKDSSTMKSLAGREEDEREELSGFEDSESENDNDEDSRHRGRFRTERPNAIRPQSSQPKSDIPDILQISKEDQEKIEEFMNQKPWQKTHKNQGAKRILTSPSVRFQPPVLQQPMRQALSGFPRGTFRNRFMLGGLNRMSGMLAMGRSGQMLGAGDGFFNPSQKDSLRHKILINPHFRGAGRPLQESRGPWEPNQKSLQSRSNENSFSQQQSIRLAQTPTQPLPPQQGSQSQYRALLSVDLTQRPPLLPQTHIIQRSSMANQQRQFLGVPQNFSSPASNAGQMQFPQSGVRSSFIPQRGTEPMMFQSPQTQQVIPSQPQQLRPPQFMPGQQQQLNLTQQQPPNFQNALQASHQPNFPSQIQLQVMHSLPQQPSLQQSNFPGQPQQAVLNQSLQSFAGQNIQQSSFRLSQPPQNVQSLSGPFVPQSLSQRGPVPGSGAVRPQVPQSQSTAFMALRPGLDRVASVSGEGNIQPLLQGFAASIGFQSLPLIEEIVGQPIETVMQRKVQSRSGPLNNPAIVPSVQAKFGSSARFTTNKMSMMGGRRQRPAIQARLQEPSAVAGNQRALVKVEAVEKMNLAELEQKQKLEERAKRFAQPPPTLLTNPPAKRLSDTPSDTLAPAAKQAKYFASRKALVKAASLQKRRDFVMLRKKLQPETSTAQKFSSAVISTENAADITSQDYDTDLQRGLEQQKLLREKVLKMKEQRRLQQAALRRKELEQRLRAEGLSDEQISAKLDTDSASGRGALTTNSTIDGADALAASVASTASMASTDSAAGLMPQQPDSLPQKKIATARGKKPAKTIVLTKSMFEAMLQQMSEQGKDLDMTGQSKPETLAGHLRGIYSGSSPKIISQPGFGATPGQVRGVGPRFHPRGNSSGMVRPKNPMTVRPRTASNVVGHAVPPRLGPAASLRASSVASGQQSRRVVQPTTEQNTSQITPANHDRRVVIGAGERSLMSSLVAIEGLALSTTAAAIRQLAEKVGPVQHIQLMSSERKALLKFHNAEHAILFAKGYNRHMLDLSMIGVTVVPP